MFVLTCPTCRQQLRVKFARLGATATCVSCKELFKLDAVTLRSEAPGGGEELPHRSGSPDRLAALAAGAEHAFVSHGTAVATPSHTKVRIKRAARPQPAEGQSPIAVVIVAAFALAAALVVWLITGGPQIPAEQQLDPHPLPMPLALAAEAPRAPRPAPIPGLREQLVEPSPPVDPVAASRIRLIEQPAGDGPPPLWATVALDPVESQIGITDSGDGSAMLLLAVRNTTSQAVRNPKLIVDLVDESGTVLRSWRGTVEATLAPGEMLEVEALPPYGMESTVGRLVLRAFASPPAANP